MELTKEQIQQVEHYLNNKYFDFIDLKPEILDHIISDVESLMAQNISFENAFKTTILKWNTHFKETSSFYFGIQYSASKIVIQKAIKQFKYYYFLYLASYFIPFILLTLFPFQIDKSSADFINGFLFSSAFIAIFYLLMIVIKTIKSKVKTTYRFILKTQYWGVILLILGVFSEVFNEKGEMNAVFTGFVCAGFSVVFICHHFYKKHLKEIHQYKIL